MFSDEAIPSAAGGGVVPGGARQRRRAVKRRKSRHALNPFKYVEPATIGKVLLALAALVGVDRKGSARAEDAEEKAAASASVAVNAQERIEVLDSLVTNLRARIRVLEAAAGKDNLAEAREEIARPKPRKAARPWWRLF